MATLYIGRRVTAKELFRAESPASTLRACVYAGPSQNVWAHTFEGWVGRDGPSTANVRYGLHEANPGPDDRIAYSAQASVTTLYDDVGPGAKVSAAIAVNDRGPSTKGVPINDGEEVAIGALALTNPMSISMQASDNISTIDENFYTRTGLSSIPDPFGSPSTSPEGNLSLWLVCDTNEKPLRGINRSRTSDPADSTPTFEWDFRDMNGVYGGANGGADRGDYVKQYRIQVRNSSNTIVHNEVYNSSSVEKASGHVVQAISTSLAPGNYQWRQQDADHFGEWYTLQTDDWLDFSIGAAGTVSVSSATPSGRTTDTTPDFTGILWTHGSSLAMTHARIQLLDADTLAVLDDSGWVAKAASSGATFTMTAANTGFGTLPWGRRYRYRVAGRASNGLESAYSAQRSFNTDFAPTTPTNMSPVATVLTSPPLVTAQWSDADDVAGANLTGVFRLTKPGGATVDVTPAYDAGTGRWGFQFTTGQFNAGFGVYSVQATGFDGTLYSGEATSLGAATWGAVLSVNYQSGPTVTVVSPTPSAVIATSSFVVTWSPGNSNFRIFLYEPGTSTVVWDSGFFAGGGSYTSWTVGPGAYENNESYDLVVQLDVASVVGRSSPVPINIVYSPPASLEPAVAATVRADIWDTFDTSVEFSWTASVDEDFNRYRIYRSASGGPDAARIALVEITSRSLTRFIDYHPASDYEYTYEATQIVQDDDGDERESVPVSASATVTLAGVVLSSVNDPATLRAVVRRTGPGRRFSRRGAEAVYYPPASRKPRTVRRRVHAWEPTIAFQLIAEHGQTARQHRWRLEALDAAQDTLCYRDDEQRKHFVTMPTFEVADELVAWTTGTLGLREEGYIEGVS